MSTALNRRQFVHTTAILTAAGTLRAQQKADSQETLRIGLVGCGGRGTGAAYPALGAEYNGKLVAMADVDMKQIDGSIASLSQKFPDRVDVKPDKKFIGIDAYKQLIDSGVDVVLLASPPGFRPMHLQAAVDAGKHIFCEKPMAVDSVGYHVAMAAVNKAKEKKLNIVAGFCWRYSTSRLEAFNRVLGGDIGKITSIYATYHTGPVKPMPPAEMLMMRARASPGRSSQCPRPGGAPLAWLMSGGRCATGTISPGAAAIVSWSRRCTAWTRSFGPWETKPP